MPALAASLDPAAAYRVILARDGRYDGRLYVGVTSTGIYCRPICRVRTPMFKNCRFFDTPAQAEAQAFRPCLKCRPETAPGAPLPWSVMDASRTLALQAAAALDARAVQGDPTSLGQLAARLGVSDRHLRRIFLAEHGVTPVQYVQTRRLLLAKQLLTDTRLPVTAVALASGFRSVRRCNAAFLAHYRMSPGRLRGAARAAPDAAAAAAVTLQLGYRAPYDVPALLRFLALRAIPEVEAVDAAAVRRSLPADCVAPTAGWLEVRFDTRRALVHVRYAPQWAPFSGRVVAAVRRWLDLDADPEAIDAVLDNLPGAPGLRLPGGLDGFELAVRAVLGQQVTVAGARTLARRLVDRFGTPLDTPWADVVRTFPAPAALAAAPLERIAELGIIRTRAAAIGHLAHAWPELQALLRSRCEPGVLIDRLCDVPGIGPWTAHYIAMRALGWPDAFLPNDVAVLKALRRSFGVVSQRQAQVQAQPWQPWRAYAVLRLWNSLEEAVS